MSVWAKGGIVVLMILILISHRLIEELFEPPPPPPASPAGTDASPQALLADARTTETPPAEAPAEGAAETVPPVGPAGGTWVVAGGETLAGISKKVYGSTAGWRRILEANRDVLPDERRMQVGMKLKIPPAEETPTASR